MPSKPSNYANQARAFNSRSFLTFDLLDRLPSQPRPDQQRQLEDVQVRRIGPLVELVYEDYKRCLDQLSILNDSEVTESLRKALTKTGISNCVLTSSLRPRPTEFIRNFQRKDEADDPRWVAFCKRLENAAYNAGVGRQFAKGLTGTMEEMAFNVLEHSEGAETAITGYRWCPGEFEYVVSDSGIGLLESLRTNPYYSNLRTSDGALEIALQEGESRHGHNVSRGLGFRDLINNIANRNSFLRFRSGGSALIIDGTVNPPSWRSQVCISAPGFLVSVVTRSPRIQSST